MYFNENYINRYICMDFLYEVNVGFVLVLLLIYFNKHLSQISCVNSEPCIFFPQNTLLILSWLTMTIKCVIEKSFFGLSLFIIPLIDATKLVTMSE